MLRLRTGWFPDAPDQRDRSAEEVLAAAGPLPDFASWRSLIVDVLDQGATSSCVANAIMQAIRASHRRQGVERPELGSRLFGYRLSRALHGNADDDGGTYLRTFFKALNQFGFPRESVWPFDLGLVNASPSWVAKRAALDQSRPPVYRRIYSSGAERVTDVKRALSLGHLVCFGTDVSVTFASSGFRQIGPVDPPVGQAIAGGHAMCVVGYDGDTFDVVNSWGEGWNRGGYVALSADYLAWSQTRDLWIVESAPVFSE